MTDRDLIGEKVVSPIYGEGSVTGVNETTKKLTIEFIKDGKRILGYRQFSEKETTRPSHFENPNAQEYILQNLDGASPLSPLDEPNGAQRTNYSRALPRSFEWLQKRVYIPRNEYFKIRGIYVTATEIIAISVVNTDPDYYVYHDRWLQSGVYLFSGEGKSGDQKETANNRALLNAGYEQKPVRLLIFDYKEYRMTKEVIYYDQGFYQVKDYTYELDYGEDKKKRKEYKFKLQYTVLNL
ncbi:MAG TPA: hypothetical protein H9663_01420 [Firmicutes bacterium]|nr:hypothetical protein [Bacillota bacterium]